MSQALYEWLLVMGITAIISIFDRTWKERIGRLIFMGIASFMIIVLIHLK